MSKKKLAKKRQQEQTRNRLLTIGLVAAGIIILLALAYVLLFMKAPHIWSLDGDGLLKLGKGGSLDPEVTLVENKADYTLERIVYKSQGNYTFSLLRIPKNVTKPPVVLVLPGATVSKEADDATAKALAAMGYASLTLDERGNYGETGGPFAGNVAVGLEAYKSGGDPVQYLQVYDVLRGIEYLKTRGDVDGNNVVILGESMGARFAVVAAALDTQVKGVVLVSGSGWGTPNSTLEETKAFYNSIEPKNYLSKIPSRKLVMIQFADDTMVTATSARQLYDAAPEPKAWYMYTGDVHGVYSPVYDADLRNELKGMFGR